jgi:hypothetical protein
MWPTPSLPSVGGGDRIGRLLDESHADFTGWAQTLADDRPGFAPVIWRILAMDEERTVRLLCALLTKYVDSLGTLPWVRDLFMGVHQAERRLRVETERAMPGWYAGACARCGSSTYVVPGLTWVTCNGIIGYTDDEEPRPIRCGMTTNAASHLEVILEEARDWVARPKPLAEALVALVDTEQSVPRLYERIHKWGKRGTITPLRFTTRDYELDIETERFVVVDVETGHARYRFGEVFDRLMAAGPTRLTDASAPPATCAC